jgi:hypothetical protein
MKLNYPSLYIETVKNANLIKYKCRIMEISNIGNRDTLNRRTLHSTGNERINLGSKITLRLNPS